MPNARDLAAAMFQKILVVGPSGSGKTSQIWTLPGKKFAYFFDPASTNSVQGLDLDYELFLPDSTELDATLKGFNKGAKDDKLPGSQREPTVYMRWVEDINKRNTEGFFKDFDWLIIDSLTLLVNALMDRQMWLNNRFGGIEDLADYRIVGTKMAEVFRSITSIPNINLFVTGHHNTFQDEKTKKIMVELNLPGKARRMLPLYFSNIWEMRSTTDTAQGYNLLTRAEARGFQEIRTSLQGLAPVEDVTIKDFNKAESYGIGRLLKAAKPRVSAPLGNRAPAPAPVSAVAAAPASTSANTSQSASQPAATPVAAKT